MPGAKQGVGFTEINKQTWFLTSWSLGSSIYIFIVICRLVIILLTASDLTVRILLFLKSAYLDKANTAQC